MTGLEGGDVLCEVRLHGGDGLVDAEVRAVDVVVHVDDVEMAVGAACGGEFVEEVETRGAAAVGDGRGCEGDLAGEGLDEVFVDGGGLGGGEV